MSNHFPIKRVYRMSSGAERHVRTDHDLVTNKDLPVINQNKIEIGIEVLTNMDMIAIRHMYRRFKEKPLSAAAKNAFHNSLTMCILSGMGIVVLKHHFLAVIPFFLQLFLLININRICVAMFIKQHTAVDSVT